MDRATALERSVTFLREIGISAEPSANSKGFLDHIRIENGGLIYDPDHAMAANLLHEAGHLAVLPSKLRQEAGPDLDDAFFLLGDMMEQTFDIENPDSPEIRAMMQCGESEATAWAWAAGKAIGLPDERIIENQDYNNSGADIRIMLSMNCYLGINGLVAGNMATSVKTYPTLTSWLQI